MKLKLMINRFTETDSVDVPINITTTYDDKGVKKLLKTISQLGSSTKNMRVSSLFADMVPADEAEKANNFMKQLRGSMKEMTKATSNKKTDPSGFQTISTELDKIKASLQGISPGTLSALVMSSVSGSPVERLQKYSTIMNVFNDLMKETKDVTNDANEELGKTKGKAEDAEKGLSKLAAIIKGSVLIQIKALAHWLKAAFTFIEHSFTAAGDYVESMNLYTMSVGEFAEAGQDWAEKISEALYLDPSEIYQFTGQFFNLTRGLGASAKAADLMSRNLTQLSYDMSSYLNIDVSVANNKLMSAMSGQTKAVTSVGIAVQSASLQELAYSLNIKKSVQEMTQAEKTYLRYIQIMRSTTQMQGDLGRTIITPTNAMRLLRTQLNLLSRAIGQVFTPLIMEAIPFVIAFTQVLTDLAKTLASAFGYKLEDYLAPADSVKQLADGFGDLDDAAKGAAKSINRTLAPFDELNVVAHESKGKGGALDNSVLSELEQYLKGYDMLEFYTTSMKKKVEGIKEKLGDLIPTILDVGAAFATWKISSGLVDLLTNKKGTFTQKIGLTLLVTSIALSYFGSLDIQQGNFWEGIGKQIGASFGVGLGVFLMTKNIKLSLVATALQFTVNAIFDADNFWAAALNILGGSLVVGASVLKYTKNLELTFATTITYAIVSTLATLIFGNEDEPTIIDKLKDSNKAAGDFRDTLKETYDTINENKDANLKLIDSHNDLYDELTDLVDENGKVKDGYEDRVEFILNQLKDAYGIEYDLTNGQIKNYQDLKKSIEDVIAQKKLEILLEANKEAYIAAMKNEKKAIEGLNKSTKKLEDAQSDLKDTEEELRKKQWELQKANIGYEGSITKPMTVQKLEVEVEKLSRTYEGQKEAVNLLKDEQSKWKESVESNTKAIAEYNEGLKLSYKGSTEEIENYMDEVTTKTDGSLSEQLQYTKTKRDEMVEYYSKTSGEIENEQTKSYDRQYQKTIEKLKEQTKGVEKLTPELKEAWGTLAKEDTKAFLDAFKDLPDDTVKKLGPIPNAIKASLNGNLAEVASELGKTFGNTLSDNMTVNKNTLQSTLNSAIQNVTLPSWVQNAPILGNIAKKFGFNFAADGGIFDTGEMFIAREAGPELVGRIGNKTAVANNDQITSAMTNAMIVALNGANNNRQPIHNTVYIGSEKVYNGMGNYIDSQNDRYGTNYVKV